MNVIKVQEDVIYNKCILNNIKIIHIADIHFNINTKVKMLLRLGNFIAQEQANYVIITGDMVDSGEITNNQEKIKELVTFLKQISTNKKVIISLGNHDIRVDCKNFFDEINKFKNIYVLDNDIYYDEDIYVSGLTLPTNFYYDKLEHESTMVFMDYLDKHSQIINKLPMNKVKIALIHSPIKLTDISILEKLANFDLILSGHTHDGMVPEILKIFFKGNGGIISPYKELFPKIARGKIIKRIKDTEITIIITGGVTKLSLVSAKWLSKFNFVYNISVNSIIIKKKEV